MQLIHPIHPIHPIDSSDLFDEKNTQSRSDPGK